jgi:hypothetical protein
MGLDVSHDCYHGGYTSFNLWRHEVARAAGVPLELMEGYYGAAESGRGPSPGVLVQCFRFYMPDMQEPPFLLTQIEELLPISWKILKPDPLHVLLNHSDCDGVIAWRNTAPLARRLEGLLPKISERWRPTTKQFIAGLRLAHRRREKVVFD